MPLRSAALSIATRSQHWRPFHITAVRGEGSKNHYETLQIPIDASPADVKKSFYKLSKSHHPDLNPSDPHAASRFVAISEAYATLSIPAKRQAYDRSLPSSSPASHRHSQRSGSFSSTSPAGGRPASGLSKRRTQFHGPPPSFYRSGGWGAHSAKRSAAQENRAEKPDLGEGGMGPGQMGWGHGNDVPHFDKEGHFRTHEQIENDKRRHRRGDRDNEAGFGRVEESKESGVLGQFLFITGILSVTGLVTSLIFDRVTRRPVKEVKK